MRKLITLSAFAAALVCLFSCETYKVKDPDMTAISNVDGKYMAFAYQDGAAEPTTMFAIVAIFLFGGESIHNFSFAMLVGCCSGTYTSILLAGTFWLFLQHKKAGE